MKEELLDNAKEFLEAAEDNLTKSRFNVAVSDFLKAITGFCDYLIYKDIKIIIKNHNERFEILKKYYQKIYLKIFNLFKKYRDSYVLKLNKNDALTLKEYAYELKRTTENKK